VHEVRFGYADAVRAELLSKDTYKKYGDRMFQMRARSFCGRDQFADVLKGIISTEEASDYEIIEGGPLAEQPKTTSTAASAPALDPNEQPITLEEATTFYHTWKGNGWHVDDAKAAAKRIAGVESSKEIKRKFYTDCMTWAKSKPEAKQEPPKQEEKPAANPDADDPPENEQR
jgi:hypothetical protein